jgi:hypothetical protein
MKSRELCVQGASATSRGGRRPLGWCQEDLAQRQAFTIQQKPGQQKLQDTNSVVLAVS